MEWHDDLAAGLPAPNPDEPKTLRQDILDELADHLTCAARQEALRAELDTESETPDEQTIVERVLARFGNPRRIARRLWFDAMKGRLMMQKLTAGLAAIAAVAAIAGCVLLWSALNSTRDVLQGTRSTLETMAAQSREDRKESQKADAAMLAQMEKLAEESKKVSYRSGWNPVSFKLVSDDEGKPLTDYTVILNGNPYGERLGGQFTLKSGDDGRADFGLVRPGHYLVSVTSPWHYSRSMQVLVRQGKATEMTVRCPTRRAERARFKVQFALPEDLAKRRVAAFVSILQPRLKAGEAIWTFPQQDPALLISSRFGSHQVVNWRGSGAGGGYPHGIPPITYFDKPHGPNGILGFFDIGRWEIQTIEDVGAWTLPHKVQTLAIVLPTDSDSSTDGVAPVVQGAAGGGQPWHIFILAYISYGKRRPLGLFSDNPPTFTPQAGKENVWKITVPPKLIENARAWLKKFDERRKKTAGKKKET